MRRAAGASILCPPRRSLATPPPPPPPPRTADPRLAGRGCGRCGWSTWSCPTGDSSRCTAPSVICPVSLSCSRSASPDLSAAHCLPRSEEHTSELQSRGHLVCRLLLEKKKKSHSVCVGKKKRLPTIIRKK